MGIIANIKKALGFKTRTNKIVVMNDAPQPTLNKRVNNKVIPTLNAKKAMADMDSTRSNIAQSTPRTKNTEETPLVMVHTNIAFTPRSSAEANAKAIAAPKLSYNPKIKASLKPPKCLSKPAIRPKLTKKLEAQRKASKDYIAGLTPRTGMTPRGGTSTNSNTVVTPRGGSTNDAGDDNASFASMLSGDGDENQHPIERAPSFEVKTSSIPLKRKLMTAGEEMGASKFAVIEKQTIISEEAAKKKLEQQKRDDELLEARIKELYGPVVLHSIKSQQWTNRRDAFESIQKFIEKNGAKNIQEGDVDYNAMTARISSTCDILKHGITDRVAPVSFATFECFRTILKVYGLHLDVSLRSNFSSLVPLFLQKMGGEATGTNRRMQKEACRCLLRLSKTAKIDGLGIIIPFLLDENIHVRPRLAILKLLVSEFQLAKKKGLKLGTVMAIAVPALQIADDKTRKAAVGVVVAAYEVVGKKLLKHLHGVKPVMLKILQRKFNESDMSRGISDNLNDGNSNGNDINTDESPSSKFRPESIKSPSDDGSNGDRRGGAGNLQIHGRSYLQPLGSSSNSASADDEGARRVQNSLGDSRRILKNKSKKSVNQESSDNSDSGSDDGYNAWNKAFGNNSNSSKNSSNCKFQSSKVTSKMTGISKKVEGKGDYIPKNSNMSSNEEDLMNAILAGGEIDMDAIL